MVPLWNKCTGHSGLHLVLIVPVYCSSQDNVNDIGCSRLFQGPLTPLLALNLVRPRSIPAFEHTPSPGFACFLLYHCHETTLARGLLTSTILGYCHHSLLHVPGTPQPQWCPTFLVSGISFITSRQIDGGEMETVTDFTFLGSKITADSDWNQEIKRCLLLGRKAMTNLDSVLKCRDITLLTKVRRVRAVVFPVVRYGCESWTTKKAESQRIDAFELWCWSRLLRDPWTARRSNQSVLKEINPEYWLEGLMLKLKLLHVGHLIQRADSLEKTLMLGKIESRRRRGQ